MTDIKIPIEDLTGVILAISDTYDYLLTITYEIMLEVADKLADM